MKKLIILLSIVVPTLLFGQVDRSKRPVPGSAPAINIKDSEVFTLKNGITVILSENHKLPRVSFDLVMGSTPRTEGLRTGLADITGSLILSGTTNRSKDQLDKEVDYLGADLTATSKSIRLSCLTKHMDKGLALMSDVLYNTNFPQDEVDRIIKQNESSLVSAKSDPGTMANNVVAKANFPNGHPYGEVMTEENLKSINRDAIVEFYREQFTPQGAYIVVVGDIDRAKTESVLNTYFANWNGSKPYVNTLSSLNTNTGNRVLFVNKPGAVQSVIYVTFPLDITPGHPDYLKLNVLNGILGGGGFGNRLMQNLREDKAFTYGCRSSLSVDEYGSYFAASGNFRNEVTDSAIHEILFELDKIIKELVKDEELDLTKSSMAGGFARSLESPATVARFALNIIKNKLPKDYYQTYLKNLAAITKEDVLATAKKYLTADKCNIVVVGNEAVLDKLIRFDSDKKIEKVDAFGNPVIDRKKADISAEELFNKYVGAVTGGLTGKALTKKLGKIKSFKEVYDIQLPQAPFPMMMTKVWVSPATEGTKMEGSGMVFQKSFFDGTTGWEFNMQTGSKEMAPEKVAARKKSVGLIPEMNYKTSGMSYEMIGIEALNGKDHYVIKINDGDTESFEYYDIKTFLKSQTISIQQNGEESQETIIVYDNYTSYDGLLFPDTMNLLIGEMSISGKIKSRTFNEKIDISAYK